MSPEVNNYTRVRDAVIALAEQASAENVQALRSNSYHGARSTLERLELLNRLAQEPEIIMGLCEALLPKPVEKETDA